MAKFWEHLDAPGKSAAVKLVQDHMLSLVEYKEKHQQSTFTLPSQRRWDQAEEAGEGMARFVHARLMEHAQPAKLAYGYTHVSRGLGISQLVREISGGLITGRAANSLAGSILNLMRANKVCRNRGGTEYHLKEWGEKFVYAPSWAPHTDYRTEKRIVEEADKPVANSVDPSIIPFPDNPSPTDLVEYVRKVVGAFRKRIDLLEAENEELRGKVRDQESLTSAAQEIRELVAS